MKRNRLGFLLLSVPLAFLFLSLGATGCYHHNEEELYNCYVDPASTTYSTAVRNILTSHGCISCHAAPVPSGGVSLDTYDGVFKAATTRRQGESLLYGAISHAKDFAAMPLGLPALSSCEIRKVKAWIDAGAPNN